MEYRKELEMVYTDLSAKHKVRVTGWGGSMERGVRPKRLDVEYRNKAVYTDLSAEHQVRVDGVECQTQEVGHGVQEGAGGGLHRPQC